MNDDKINVIYNDFDEHNIIVSFKKGDKNICFIFGLYEFESEMEYWDMPTKLKKYNGENGFVFSKSIDKADLEMEINRFIKHNELDKLKL